MAWKQLTNINEPIRPGDVAIRRGYILERTFDGLADISSPYYVAEFTNPDQSWTVLRGLQEIASHKGLRVSLWRRMDSRRWRCLGPEDLIRDGDVCACGRETPDEVLDTCKPLVSPWPGMPAKHLPRGYNVFTRLAPGEQIPVDMDGIRRLPGNRIYSEPLPLP